MTRAKQCIFAKLEYTACPTSLNVVSCLGRTGEFRRTQPNYYPLSLFQLVLWDYVFLRSRDVSVYFHWKNGSTFMVKLFSHM